MTANDGYAKEPYKASTPEDRARRRGNWDASLATGQKRAAKGVGK